jgi:dTDP-4-amino-4,6-dideoxygalactose transaminase
MKAQIPFNKPYKSGKELEYIGRAIENQKISGNGEYTRKCQQFFESKYPFRKTLLTSSCTDALEMCALLLDLQPGDEVIAPSYTFVSTVNAFILRGAKIVFADSYADHPNIDADAIEALITPKTKAIVVVHYAGHACDMDKINSIASKHNIAVIEDAAQAIDAFYKGKALGSLSAMSAFSFHETKNIISGEGGMLVVNDDKYAKRSEIIWEKGTNRSAFFRGEVDKYGWVDVGSSFLPSDMVAAYLYAQLENLDDIQNKRIAIWNQYWEGLKSLEAAGHIQLPKLPEYATNNAHMFYIVCTSLADRTALIDYLKEDGINAVFHYLSLHNSPFYKDKHDGRALPNSDHFTDCLLRLPLYYTLSEADVARVCERIQQFYTSK